jgi:hypothetical protein
VSVTETSAAVTQEWLNRPRDFELRFRASVPPPPSFLVGRLALQSCEISVVSERHCCSGWYSWCEIPRFDAARERAVFDYSGMFPHVIITLKYSNIEIGCVGIRIFIGHGNIQYTTLQYAVTLRVVVLETEYLL